MDESFARPEFDDRGWDELPVPGHWVLHGHGGPAYTNTGMGADALLRFEGVESRARVWLNGREPGAFQGSRLPHEFSVGAPLRPQGNVLAVRAHQWSAGSCTPPRTTATAPAPCGWTANRAAASPCPSRVSTSRRAGP